jgi:plastocyanin
MPFTWQIKINKNPAVTPRVRFDPNPLNNVEIGDQIIWTNNDNSQHWPALKTDGQINNQYFMANPIAPNSPSDTFVPSAAGTVNYVCYFHQEETGSINIVASQ